LSKRAAQVRWFIVWTPKTKRLLVQVLEESGGCVVLLIEYDYCLINWKRADFAPQIEINK
jgi:hypothetical protein